MNEQNINLHYSLVKHTEHWIAVHKPHGLLVHKTFIDQQSTDNLVKQLRHDLQQTIYPVHRLDKPTSGIMVFALNANTAKHLGRQFEQHLIQKTYWAIVRGWLDGSGSIDHPLKRIEDNYDDPRRRQSNEAQPAITYYTCLAQIELPVAVDKYPSSRYSLVELNPQTGRQHQLRRHLKHISHPIIGDVRYGKGTHNRFFESHFGVRRLMLHAKYLTFEDTLGRQETLQAPITESDDLHRVIQQLGWPILD